ncbi:MAG: hypothetical protein V1889_02135 [archaeon]
MQKEKIHKPEYKYLGKESLSEIIGKIFPKKLIPTTRMSAIFGGIFVLALILAIFNFPLSSLIAGDTNITIGIGYPYPFLDLGPTSIDKSPLKPFGLAVDMILYLIIAYAIDVLLNFLIQNPFNKKESEKYPETFKDQAPRSISETITKQIFKEPLENTKSQTAKKPVEKSPAKTIKTTNPRERNQPSSPPSPSRQF